MIRSDLRRKPRRSSRAQLGLTMALMIAAAPGVPASAQVSDLESAERKAAREEAEAQGRVDAIADETRDLLSEYRAKLAEATALERYLDQAGKIRADRAAELERLKAERARLERIKRELLPTLDVMVEGLAAFIRLDLPFRTEERLAAVDSLRGALIDGGVPMADKVDKVAAAYEAERAYGTSLETYPGVLLDGRLAQQVIFLRIGRLALLAQTPDGSFSRAYDPSIRDWRPLEGTDKDRVRRAIAMARGDVPSDLLVLPVPARPVQSAQSGRSAPASGREVLR